MTEPNKPGAGLVAPNEFVEFVSTVDRGDSQILQRIESLNVSADAKALLADLMKLATRVGEHLIRIGRKILDFVLSLLKQFPHIGFAALLVIVVSALLSVVPVLGVVLSTVLTPLALALGVSWGAYMDATSPDLGERVKAFAAHFENVAS